MSFVFVRFAHWKSRIYLSVGVFFLGGRTDVGSCARIVEKYAVFNRCYNLRDLHCVVVPGLASNVKIHLQLLLIYALVYALYCQWYLTFCRQKFHAKSARNLSC